VTGIAAAALPLILVAGLLGASMTAAQTVYRCGNAYGPVPCPQGTAIDADDSRTSAQRNEALRIAADDKRRGDEMERARLRREAAIQPALASPLTLAPAPAATAAPAKKPMPKNRQAKPSKERQLAVIASASTRPKKN
jgi:hypothetical protein